MVEYKNRWKVFLQTNSKRGSQDTQHIKLDTSQRQNNTKVGIDEKIGFSPKIYQKSEGEQHMMETRTQDIYSNKRKNNVTKIESAERQDFSKSIKLLMENTWWNTKTGISSNIIHAKKKIIIRA